MTKRLLLICGILASLLYMGSDIVAGMRYEGYSFTAQAVSELRALGAPTRPFLLPILYIYGVLEIAFGLGVWRAAGRQRGLQITGALLITLGVVDLVAPSFPMNMRGAESTLTDTLHIILTAVTVLLLLLIVVFGASANGKGFRYYSYFTLLLILGGGVLAGFDGARLAAGQPTPWLGVTERFNIYGYMVWLLVLAIILLRAKTTFAQDQPHGRSPGDQAHPRYQVPANLGPRG